jgi:dipeptide/tripeptide permease
MVLITLAVSLKSLHPQCTPDGACAAASRQQVAFFYGALYTMAIGAGGTKPNISTFGADQFDDFDAREREVKASFFNCLRPGGPWVASYSMRRRFSWTALSAARLLMWSRASLEGMLWRRSLC